MASKIVKTIFLYIGIIIGAILSLIVVLGLMMFFVPSFRFFGLGIINENVKSQDRVIKISDYTTDYINKIDFIISTKSFGVDIVYDEEAEDITYYYLSNVIGFTTDKIATRMYKDVVVENGVMTVSITQAEPNGFLYFVDSKVVITVPVYTTSSDMYQYGVVTNTATGDVAIKGVGEKYFNLRYLNVTTTSGGLHLEKVGTEAKTATLSSLVIFTENGTFDFSSIEALTVQEPIQITSTDSTIKFDDVYAGMNVQGQDIEFTADIITTNEDGFEINAYSGEILINKIISDTAENIFISNECYINIKEITGKTGINTSSANVDISILRDTAIIKSGSGDVSIKFAFGDLIEVVSDDGNIKVDDYKKNGIFTSTNGSIDVYSNSDYQKDIKTKINTENGVVNAKIKANCLLLNTTGKANVSIIFETIAYVQNETNSFQHRVIIAGKSKAKVYMPTVDCVYRFKATGVITGSILGLIDEVTGNAVNVSSKETEQYYPSASPQNQARATEYATFLFEGGSIEFQGYTQSN